MSDKFESLITNNKLGIKDYNLFEKVSRDFTLVRTKQLETSPIKGNFDFQHLKDIHKYIFQDVFEWAGKDRQELGLLDGFGKRAPNGEITSFVPGSDIKKYADIIFSDLKEQNYLKNSKDINQFAKGAANLLMNLNALHPFREGNGRTQRVFMNQLAKNAGYKLDLALIPKETMIKASVQASKLKPQLLEAAIKTNLKSFKQNLSRNRVMECHYNSKIIFFRYLNNIKKIFIIAIVILPFLFLFLFLFWCFDFLL
ncbi:Fic/DOC family protein [Campylobacter ureolyticus]|uniref:Fic/DOC family protein n=1 Tax=Campylobacter ureolyticus TaxID=827 RepID=UPI0020827ECF|nr:hypothetical protein CE91St25_17240 [Campylobacter ureolyticus]